MKCTGKPECPVHPHIRSDHPSEPVTVTYDDGSTFTIDYSDKWDAIQREWETTLSGLSWDME